MFFSFFTTKIREKERKRERREKTKEKRLELKKRTPPSRGRSTNFTGRQVGRRDWLAGWRGEGSSDPAQPQHKRTPRTRGKINKPQRGRGRCGGRGNENEQPGHTTDHKINNNVGGGKQKRHPHHLLRAQPCLPPAPKRTALLPQFSPPPRPPPTWAFV